MKNSAMKIGGWPIKMGLVKSYMYKYSILQVCEIRAVGGASFELYFEMCG